MKRLIGLFLACLFLNSCGKNLTVNLAEAVLLWRVDDYFDLRQDQRKMIKSDFRQALKSVNEKDLPGFEKIVFDESLINKNCSDVEKSYLQLKPQLEEIRSKFLKLSAGFIDSVDEEQVKYFIKKAKEEIAKDEAITKTERINKLEKKWNRTQDIMTEIFGDLTKSQQQSLQDHVLKQKDFSDLILQSRKKNLALLMNKSDTEVKIFMKDYVSQWRDYQTPELKAAVIERETYFEKFYLNFFCQASGKQKKYFQATVLDYLKLIRQVYIDKN